MNVQVVHVNMAPVGMVSICTHVYAILDMMVSIVKQVGIFNINKTKIH